MKRSITSKKSITSITGGKKTCITCNTCNTFATFSLGQSLFELVIAIGISAIVITVLVSLVANSMQNAAYSKNQTLASRYAVEATEWLRGQRDNNIDSFLGNIATASWCLKDSPLTNASWNDSGACGLTDYVSGTNNFKRQVDFNVTTVNAKTIIAANISVSWTDSKGTHKVTSATNFADWRQR